MLDNSVISHKALQTNLTDLSRHCQSSTGLVKAELKNCTSYLMKSRLYLGGGVRSTLPYLCSFILLAYKWELLRRYVLGFLRFCVFPLNKLLLGLTCFLVFGLDMCCDIS